MAQRDAFIVDAVRTPIGKYGSALAQVRADDLAAIPIRALLSRNSQIPPSDIYDVILGCANQAGEDNRNVARMALLLAGLPISVPGETVNRLCGSGMAAVINAARAIETGDAHLMIAGGIEHMTRSPYVMAKPEKAFQRSPEVFDTTLGWRFVNRELERLYGIDSMGQTAENVARQYSISRSAQDNFAHASQVKASAAQKQGLFDREITGVPIPASSAATTQVLLDEFIRHDSSSDKLSILKPAFAENGTVTGGNSSGINDGAAAMLLASESALRSHSLKPRARIAGSFVIGVEPRVMGMGPVAATQGLLKKTGVALKDISVIELNEAFAAQSLACLSQLGIAAGDPRVNRLGGAIALGHPLGMSGTRLVGTAVNQLEVLNARYALCTMCIGVGQGIATLIERT